MKRIIIVTVVTLFLMSGYAIAGESSWSTTYGNMQLSLNGSTVTGTYGTSNGFVMGTLQGNNTFMGWWMEDNYTASCGPNNQWAGPFQFSLAADGTKFFGEWDTCPTTPDQLNPLAANWNGSLCPDLWQRTTRRLPLTEHTFLYTYRH